MVCHGILSDRPGRPRYLNREVAHSFVALTRVGVGLFLVGRPAIRVLPGHRAAYPPNPAASLPYPFPLSRPKSSSSNLGPVAAPLPHPAREEGRPPPSADEHFPIEPILGGIKTGRFGQARAALRDALLGPALEDFSTRVDAYRRELPDENPLDRIVIADPAVRRRLGQIPVAILTDDAHAALTPVGSTIQPPRLVWMSPETAIKQLKHGRSHLRRPLRPEHYRLLPEIVETGRFLAADERRLRFFRTFDRLYEAVGKRTRNNELFLTTFHFSRAHDLRAAIRRERSLPR